MGDRLTGRLSLGQPNQPLGAAAEIVIMHINESEQRFSVRFLGHSPDLKILLKQAFALAT